MLENASKTSINAKKGTEWPRWACKCVPVARFCTAASPILLIKAATAPKQRSGRAVVRFMGVLGHFLAYAWCILTYFGQYRVILGPFWVLFWSYFGLFCTK